MVLMQGLVNNTVLFGAQESLEMSYISEKENEIGLWRLLGARPEFKLCNIM